MARIRSIKPGFFENEELAQLPPLARLLFAGLWCWADREGRLEDRPVRLKSQILGYDDCDVDTLLDQLSGNPGRFIIRYEVDGSKYIAINNFCKHQLPHHREAPSTIPGYAKARPKPGLNRAKHNLGEAQPRAKHNLGEDEPCLACARAGILDLGSGILDLGSGVLDPVLGILEAAPLVADGDASGGLESLIRRWNNIEGVRPSRIENAKRKAAYNARRREPQWLANLEAALDRVAQSGFCRGSGSNGWIADLDWFLRPGTVAGLIEGKYDDRDGPVLSDLERKNLEAGKRWLERSNDGSE